MTDEPHYPELDRLAQERRDENLVEAARLLLLSRLDELVPPGRPAQQACSCCAGDGSYRLREHVCRKDSSKVRRYCRRCDEPGRWTIPELFPHHPVDACEGCTDIDRVA